MGYAVVFSSRTGNTALLAETIRDTLPREDCLYFGPPTPRLWRRTPYMPVFGPTRAPVTGPWPPFWRD